MKICCVPSAEVTMPTPLSSLSATMCSGWRSMSFRWTSVCRLLGMGKLSGRFLNMGASPASFFWMKTPNFFAGSWCLGMPYRCCKAACAPQQIYSVERTWASAQLMMWHSCVQYLTFSKGRCSTGAPVTIIPSKCGFGAFSKYSKSV